MCPDRVFVASGAVPPTVRVQVRRSGGAAEPGQIGAGDQRRGTPLLCRPRAGNIPTPERGDAPRRQGRGVHAERVCSGRAARGGREATPRPQPPQELHTHRLGEYSGFGRAPASQRSSAMRTRRRSHPRAADCSSPCVAAAYRSIPCARSSTSTTGVPSARGGRRSNR